GRRSRDAGRGGQPVLARGGRRGGGGGQRRGRAPASAGAVKTVRVPGWLGAGVLERYHAGASHLFLLHGNVRDVHPFGTAFVPLAEGLRRLAGRRAIAVSYDVSSGLSFPDAEREKAFRKTLGLRGALPADPARALVVLDALVGSDRAAAGSVAVVIDYAHTLAPADGAGPPERQNITPPPPSASHPAPA